MKCVCPMGGDRTCPDDCLLAKWANLSPTDRKAQRKPAAEQLYKQGFAMEQIATQLGVSVQTISTDLQEFSSDLKTQPRASKRGRKGEGRPKGSKRPVGERSQDPIRINAAPEEWEAFKERAAEEGTTAAAKLGELIKEPEIDPATLSKTAQQKLQTAIRQQMQKLGAEFYQRVNERAMQHVNEYWLPEHQKQLDQAQTILKARKGIMDKATFDKIRRCLHPDSRATATEKRLAEAFDAFMALEKRLLDEKDSPTTTYDLPKTAAEWDAMKAKATAARKAKRNSGSSMERRH